MTITRGSTWTDANTAVGSSGTLTTGAAAATAGRTVLVFIRNGTGGSAPGTPTDTAGNTYTLLTSDTSNDPQMWVYVAKNITGNASNQIQSTFTDIVFAWLYAVEYDGCDTTTPQDIYGVNTGTATDCVSTSLTTSQSGDVLVMAVSQAALTTYTAGTDFTLISGAIGTGGSNYGGIEEYITTTQLSAYTAHITSGSSAGFTTIWVALKPAGGGGVSTTPPRIQSGGQCLGLLLWEANGLC